MKPISHRDALPEPMTSKPPALPGACFPATNL